MSEDGPGNKRREAIFGGTPLPPPTAPTSPPFLGEPPSAAQWSTSDPQASPLVPPGGGQAWYVPPAPKKSRKGRAIIATVGAVAVLAGGTFAAVALSSSDGASSPSAAVAGFFTALDHEDALGMLDALPAGERNAIRPLVEEFTSEAQRLGITSKIDLGQVKGLDIEVVGLETHSEDLGDGVAGVWIDSGDITVNVVPHDVPIGDNLKALIEHVTGVPVTITAASDHTTMHMDSSDSPIVTIKDGGGWKLSAFYTYAEAARRDSDAALPDFGQGLDAVGSDSPEAAVKALADATAAYDLEQLIALTPPQEMRALHDYAPLFLSSAREAASQLKDNTGLVITITRLDLDPSGSGDRRSVAVTGFAAHVESNDGSGDVDFDGKCLTVTGDLAKDLPNGTQKSCTGDISPEVTDLGLEDLAGRVGQPLTITVVKEDGKWYVSPIGTVGETFLSVLRVLKPEDFQDGGAVYKFIDALRDLGSEFGIEGG
jgi:hypothetical protein